MIIQSSFDIDNSLNLRAYSFKIEEISAVSYILIRAKVNAVVTSLDLDIRGRFGTKFTIKSSEIIKLEDSLSVRFINEFGKTSVYVNPGNGGGSAYRCQRIDTPPHSCQTIFADGDQEAMVKCALIANSNNWLGGVPKPGAC